MKAKLLILLVFLSAISLIAGVGTFRAFAAREIASTPVLKPAVVRTAPLERRAYVLSESFYGFVEANVTLDLGFQISGRLSLIGPDEDTVWRENEPVSEGQLLAQIDPRRYEAALAQARAQASQAKAAQDAAQATLDDAMARQDDAQAELERVRSMREAASATDREVERAETAMRMAQAAVTGAKAQLAATAAAYDSAEASASMSQVNLGDATLEAPWDGVIARVPADRGKTVMPGETVLSLIDTSRVKLVIGVVERRLGLLSVGQEAAVEIRALESAARLGGADQSATDDALLAGRISMIPPAADPVTGLFNVEIDLSNPQGVLRPGMVGRAVVTLREAEGVVIPAGAVRRDGDRLTAFFVEQGYTTGLDLGGLGKAKVEVPAYVARRLVFEPQAFDRNSYIAADPPEGVTHLVIEGQNLLEEGQPVLVLDEIAAR